MELRQLRYFVAVAEELHFRRAAERLHISQPPLSQQIRSLEDELGFALLVRTRRRVQLTPAGEAFLRDARAILSELEGAVATAQRIDAGQTGRLRIGFVGSALLSIVPGTVERFRSSRPGVAIELRERSTVDQLRAVAAGVIDVGLVRPPIEDEAGLRAETVLRERTVAALPAAHQLAALQRVPMRRLAAEPLVLFPRAQAPGFHDLLIEALAGAGGGPRVIQYAPEMLTIIGLVAAGTGVSLVPASVSRLSLDGVAYRPVTGAPRSELVAITRAGEDSAVVRAFVAEATAAE
ncbi:MAG TPA: LysR substrate-binding domain-containing protein [Solirubrobacteraceae bacterium]|jgi:DNA-binding transcriptional LysR family regulator|nr:LysR substrate-binding domain-containing protein [Solirubrobacteraceae bacterium]